ncbi:F-box/RNI/FBD-like domain protein [Rhynchospora pubera]|uniref:F-box/RNI/FBD-like domain protein n=1 Tax=Rhynchospora pubera TaxID=906938 RepID=A0AAV8HTN3_9POAL|nr:F-box/RNI/FBD-like domain protein [Rhynchospora pubera]
MAGVDRLSALPLEIKTSILRLLPIDQAVRTSSLSRSWRYVWTQVTRLSLDLSFPFDPDMPLARVKVLEYIIFSLRDPLIDLNLDLWYFGDDHEAPHLFKFLHMIFPKDGLQTLSIYNNGDTVQIELPYFQSLRVLTLSSLTLNHLLLPSDFQGFAHLEDLSLDNVWIYRRDIDLLINGSKNLKAFQGHLYTYDAEPLTLTFSSPKLTSIEYYFNESTKEVRVINAPCLEEAQITVDTVDSSSEEFALIAQSTSKFMAEVANVSDLLLDFATLKYISQDSVSCALQVQFLRLRSLHLADVASYRDERVFATFCCLLRNMPILESLAIKCCYPQVMRDAFPLDKWVKKEDSISCLEQSLKRLTIFVPKTINTSVIGMICFIVLNAKVLKLVEIIYMEDRKVEPRIVKGLNLVQKASSDVKVVFSSMPARR